MRKLVAVVAATAFLSVCMSSSNALQTTAPVKAPNGISYVVSTAQALFQGLINEFKELGYKVGEIGCKSTGHMHNSKHHWGGACDLFSQYARDKGKNMPPASVQIAVAHKHGLRSGCEWKHRDCGHFEVPGPNTPSVNKVYLAALHGGSYHLAADTSVAKVATLAQQVGVDDISLVMRETKHGNYTRSHQRHQAHSRAGRHQWAGVGGRHRARVVRLEAQSGHRYSGYSEGNYLASAAHRSSQVQRAEKGSTTKVLQRQVPQYEGRFSQEHGV